MATSKTDSADGVSHVERLNRDVDEIMAGLERGDPSHVRAAAELMRRWEQKGWRLEPPARPGEPPRTVKVDYVANQPSLPVSGEADGKSSLMRD